MAAPSINCLICGYDLAGLPATSTCPECATPIERSLEAYRRPLRWRTRLQRAALHPKLLWSELVPHEDDVALLMTNCFTGAFLHVFSVLALFGSALAIDAGKGTGPPLTIGSIVLSAPAVVFSSLTAVAATSAAIALALLAAAHVSRELLTFFAPVRSRAAVVPVVAHASFGFVIVGLAFFLIVAVHVAVMVLMLLVSPAVRPMQFTHLPSLLAFVACVGPVYTAALLLWGLTLPSRGV